MDLRQLRYFVAVAEELHFGRAAALLGIAQPPLSQQIQKLERALAVTLFDRTRQRVVLTRAGRILLPLARDLLAKSEGVRQAVTAAHARNGRRLRVGYTTFALADVVPRLLLAHGRASPENPVSLRAMPVERQLSAVADGDLEAGLVPLPSSPPHGIKVHVLARERLAVVLPAGHALSARPTLRVEDLRREPLILPARTTGNDERQLIGGLLAAAGVTPHVAQEAACPIALLAFTRAGLGLAVVPASLPGADGQGLVLRPLSDAHAYVDVAIAWRAGSSPAPLRGLLDVARSLSMNSGLPGPAHPTPA